MLEYPELGMEAVWKIEVVDFPAFIVVDDKGNDFFADASTRRPGRWSSGSRIALTARRLNRLRRGARGR